MYCIGTKMRNAWAPVCVFVFKITANLQTGEKLHTNMGYHDLIFEWG